MLFQLSQPTLLLSSPTLSPTHISGIRIKMYFSVHCISTWHSLCLPCTIKQYVALIVFLCIKFMFAFYGGKKSAPYQVALVRQSFHKLFRKELCSSSYRNSQKLKKSFELVFSIWCAKML